DSFIIRVYHHNSPSASLRCSLVVNFDELRGDRKMRLNWKKMGVIVIAGALLLMAAIVGFSQGPHGGHGGGPGGFHGGPGGPHDELEVANAREASQIHSLLTPEQKTKLAELHQQMEQRHQEWESQHPHPGNDQP